jgi:hypothetical protein
MRFYFSKNLIKDYQLELDFVKIGGLDNVRYVKCEHCGFVLSETHAKLSTEEYEYLNQYFHSRYQGSDGNPDDPRWKERITSQSALIADMVELGLLDKNGHRLDYACGDGSLSEELHESFGIELLCYDKYMHSGNIRYLTDDELKKNNFDLVITTSVFEHLLKREYFDEINSLVSKNGVMGLHTMVRETIPRDPTWFYLLPVHCAFHTNKSMSILFNQWKYQCSIYNVEARIWFWFKSDPDKVESIIQNANKRTGKPLYIFKRGFVDYWKE